MDVYFVDVYFDEANHLGLALRNTLIRISGTTANGRARNIVYVFREPADMRRLAGLLTDVASQVEEFEARMAAAPADEEPRIFSRPPR